MAPISPDSLKRSSPSHSDDDSTDERPNKKRKTTPTLPQTPPPEEFPAPQKADDLLFDDDPQQLLQRSIALALEHVGFTGASPEAMAAFGAAVDSYASHFLSKITSSMLNARRPYPTPADFQNGLREFDLPLASLRPHLKPPVPRSKSQIQLEVAPAAENKKLQEGRLGRLLGPELNGDGERQEKSYIPRKFISFPSKHTYKWTDKEPARETDARKIREEGVKQARQAEALLRKFTKTAKAAKERHLKQLAEQNPRSSERHKLLMKMKADLASKMPNGASGAARDEDRSMIVNSESQYYRKGTGTKRRATAPEN